MTKREVDALELGLYRVHWKGDERTSLAAVGMTRVGTRWLAPTNWVLPCVNGGCWRLVKSMEKINASP